MKNFFHAEGKISGKLKKMTDIIGMVKMTVDDKINKIIYFVNENYRE